MFLCLCRERGLTQVKTGAVQEGSQPTAQSESIGKDCERTGAAGDDRSHKSSERYRETQREHDDDEDRE